MNLRYANCCPVRFTSHSSGHGHNRASQQANPIRQEGIQIKRYIVIGAALFVLFAIVFAPASLLPMALERMQSQTAGNAKALDIAILRPTGTLWRGSGELLIGGQALGLVSWAAKPQRLLSAKLALDFSLQVPKARAQPLLGSASLDTESLDLELSGELSGAWVSQWLTAYDVDIGGEFSSQGVNLSANPARPQESLTVSGTLHWSGGLVGYKVGQTFARQKLEPLRAELGGNISDTKGIQAEVFGQASFPLLRLGLLPTGFAKVSITQRLTELVGSPWPGSDPGHAVVLEVEQPVF